MYQKFSNRGPRRGSSSASRRSHSSSAPRRGHYSSSESRREDLNTARRAHVSSAQRDGSSTSPRRGYSSSAQRRGFSSASHRSYASSAPHCEDSSTVRFERATSAPRRSYSSSAPRRSAKGSPQRGSKRPSKNAGQYIHPSKYVNKAVAPAKEVAYTPKHRFEDFAIEQNLKDAIAKKGYTTPTPIQDQCIPYILEGRDVVGIANTGTGKTAAFLVPLINKILKDRNERVLIIVPTRELALQIESELKGFAFGMQIFGVTVVGGMSEGPQLSSLRRQHNFIIGTPGRLKDFIERGKIILSQFGTVVLDEADRMLDMGFINDMRAVMAGMQENRHTLFFSATLSSDIENLIGEFLHNPVRISVKQSETSQHVEQDVVPVPVGASKIDILHDLLIQKEFSKVLVFGRTKHGVEKLNRALVNKGFAADSIHGNKTHSQRQRALGKFKNNEVQVLVATDVAARGLDIADISHVINYDAPMTYEDYVHRIGRTGRGETRGKALTFVEQQH